MSGFTDLVDQAQPAIWGGGVSLSASAGRTWRWTFDEITDNDGEPIDLSSITADCAALESRDGSPAITLDFDGGLGEFTISADEADTTGLFTGGNYVTGRKLPWYLSLSNGVVSVQVWAVDNSELVVRRGA